MVLPPIVVDRRFHIFMNSIPYPKGSLNVLIAHFGTFSCKCGIRTEINSLFIRGGANEGNQIATAAESFCGFFTPIFKISCSRLWKNTLARRCRQQREKCKAAVERVRGSLRANQQRERMPLVVAKYIPLIAQHSDIKRVLLYAQDSERLLQFYYQATYLQNTSPHIKRFQSAQRLVFILPALTTTHSHTQSSRYCLPGAFAHQQPFNCYN